LKNNLLRFQFNHHFLKYDRNYYDMPENIGNIYRDEIILSYIYMINLNRFYLGVSGGLGYCYEKVYLTQEKYILFPFAFEMGLNLNKIISGGFEIRKNIFIEESSYFLGLRFEIRPAIFYR